MAAKRPSDKKHVKATDDQLQNLTAEELPACLAYARSLFANLIEWYKSADAKAQVILSLDGALLAFLTASVFTKRQEFKDILEAIKGESLILISLALMCATLFFSIVC